MGNLGIILGAVLLVLEGARAQNANCDYSQNVVPGNVYYVYSPGYDAYYRPGVECRWMLYCPSGYNCRADCNVIELPKTPSCSSDKFFVSRSGDPQLSAADYYCGTGTLTNVVSTGQVLALGLASTPSSRGGRFMCEVRAQLASSTPTNCYCGYKRTNRIVGGQSTQPNEYPMMAGIKYVNLEEIKCGATIISNKHVLTAGHCVFNRPLSSTVVVVGEHDVSKTSDSPATQDFKSQKITVHPQYSATNYVNDIAIVEVQGTITFSEYVGPVCLPFKFASDSLVGVKVDVLGWGTTSSGSPKSKVLQKVTLDVISQSQCQSAYPSITDTQICTFTLAKDACQDDSGGPLMNVDSTTGRLFLVGIISYGSFCASRDFPGINTRVTAYLNWIVNNAPADYCRV